MNCITVPRCWPSAKVTWLYETQMINEILCPLRWSVSRPLCVMHFCFPRGGKSVHVGTRIIGASRLSPYQLLFPPIYSLFNEWLCNWHGICQLTNSCHTQLKAVHIILLGTVSQRFLQKNFFLLLYQIT